MLSIYFGEYPGDNYISSPVLFFDNAYEDEWLEDELSKAMVKDVDRSDLINPNLLVSPALGAVPISRMSGGVKTLILISHDTRHVYNASACGDNCARWLLKTGQEKDILVRLGHIMHFGDSGQLNIRIANTGETVHSQDELTRKVILEGLLDGGEDL